MARSNAADADGLSALESAVETHFVELPPFAAARYRLLTLSRRAIGFAVVGGYGAFAVAALAAGERSTVPLVALSGVVFAIAWNLNVRARRALAKSALASIERARRVASVGGSVSPVSAGTAVSPWLTVKDRPPRPRAHGRARSDGDRDAPDFDDA